MDRKARTGKRLVRAERIDTANGSLGHMSVDEIRMRLIGKNINVSCPECGRIHLTREEAEEAENWTQSSKLRHA